MHQRKLFGKLAVVTVAVMCFTGSQLLAQPAQTKNSSKVKSGSKAAIVPSVPPVTFAAPVDYTVGTLPFANAVGDFNGDHILDVATVNYTSNNVSVLFGKGDGTFEPVVNYPVGTEPTAITVGDFNNDGSPDIAVADEIGQTVGILINNADGSGTFKPVVLYPAGQAPRGIVAGDTRGIGILDLVVANNLGGNVTVFLGNGDGTFKAGVNYAADVNPKSVALADFNGDGHLDIVCVNHNTNDASILLGNGDGTFQAPVDYATGTDPRHVLVADFNKDGKWDLAVANGGESTVSILYGNGDGTFQTQVKYNTSTSPRWLAIADYNNDGFLDIASSNYDAKNISVLLGTGLTTGAFLAPQNYIVGANPTGLVAGDFNGDGLPDIAVTIGGLPTAPNTLMAVLLNAPVTISPASLSFPIQVLGVASAAQVVTLKNGAPNSLTITNFAFSGSAAADFSQTNNCGNALSGGASCAINVVFTPKGINNFASTLTISDSAPGGAQTVAVTGVGTIVSLSPTSLAFASQTVGIASTPQVITLTNVSAANTISLTGLAITGTNSTDFTETNTCGTSVAAKKSCTISVTFNPTAIGARSAAVSFTDNGGGSPQSVPLTGTGTSSVTVSPTSITFPVQVLNTTSAPQVVTLTNGTAAALAISSIANSGGNATDFPETNNCGTSLAASSSCTINVTFKPSNINHRATTLTITDGAGTQTVALSGTSTAASISPASLTFAAQTVGTTSAGQVITLTDASGGTAITITSIAITGTNITDFAQTNTCGTSVAPKKSCTITVTFDPTATGTRSAAVSVTDNAGVSPQTVTLTGTGQ
jgi:hypothetical protein